MFFSPFNALHTSVVQKQQNINVVTGTAGNIMRPLLIYTLYFSSQWKLNIDGGLHTQTSGNQSPVSNMNGEVPVWKTTSFPPTPAASKLMKARTCLAHGCWVMKPWLAWWRDGENTECNKTEYLNYLSIRSAANQQSQRPDEMIVPAGCFPLLH